jgi:lipopolysaccharide export system protein LptA
VKSFLSIGLLGLLLVAGLAGAAGKPEAKPAEGDEEVTIITADKLTADYKQHYALFEGNVVVTDPQMQLTSDKLTVAFDANNKIKSIKAEGKVNIRQTDKVAKAEEAIYDIDSGKVVLSGKPRVMRGKDMLEGETITMFRNESRILVHPRARLVVYPEKGGAREQFFGPNK